jgi:hypothetical protein
VFIEGKVETFRCPVMACRLIDYSKDVINHNCSRASKFTARVHVVSRAERVKSFIRTKAPLWLGLACAKKKSRVYTRKEKDFFRIFYLSVSFIQQQSTKFIAQQTRKEKKTTQDSGEPRSTDSLTHSPPISTNCCFCCRSRRRS